MDESYPIGNGMRGRRSIEQIREDVGPVAWEVRRARREAGLSQEELARHAGVGLRFVRELELGKSTLRMDKVQQVLLFFGKELGVVDLPEDRR